MPVILFSMLFVSCNSQNRQQDYPAAVNGYLDLSTWDFANNGAVDLRGEWKFKWMKDSEEFGKAEYNDTDWDIFPVPHRWSRQLDDNNGFCWLRLTVKIDTKEKLGLYLWGAETAYSLLINGTEILKNGSPGNNPETIIPDHIPLYGILPESDKITIAWKIANFNETDRGGPTHAPRIGINEEIKKDISRYTFYNSLVLGIILMMGIYHVLLWFGRRKDSSSILFALFCFLIFIRALCTSALMSMLLPEFNVYLLKMKLEFLSISIGSVVFITFLSRLYPIKFNSLLLRILQAAGLVLSLFILVFPIHVYLYSLSVLQILIIIIGLFSIYLVILAVIRKEKESGIVMAGLLLLLLAAANDLLYVQQITDTAFITQAGLVMFIISLSVVLSIRSARAYRTAEHLSFNLRKEVDEQTKIIKKQNEEKTSYFINLAHETKTPLTLILNYLDKYITKAGMDKELSVIKENLGKLKNNMANFLDYEKLERGQDFYDHSQITNISGALTNSLKLFRETAEKSGIKLVEKTIVKDAVIKADPYAVGRIINNLLGNAIKYTDADGTVTVNLKRSSEHIILSIKDNGIGIPEDQLVNIFESYYQVSRKKRNIQGIGMGLNIVKKIMDDLNGTIDVKSIVDQGSEFILFFRKYKGKYTETKEILPEDSYYPVKLINKNITEDDKEEPEKYTILVVEDNPDMLFYLKEELGGFYNVFTAGNGRKALEKTGIMKNINLVISDVMMDEMDGFDFYKEFKKNELFKAIPFIFLTAKNTRHDKLKALAGGAVDYINKPFDIEELRAKIYSIIRLGEFQFEQSKAQLVKNLITVNYRDSINEDSFSLIFEKKCFKFCMSSREKEVILLLLEGKTNREIAEKLFIAESTVKYHIKNIYSKCNVNRKVELINVFRI